MNNSIDALNKMAAKYTEGDLRVYQVCESPARENTPKRYALQWRIDYGPSSIFMFLNPGAWCESLDAAIEKEASELKERMTMNIFGTELFPYIQGDMLANAGDVTLTMADVKVEELTNNRGKDNKPIVFFKERKKGLILNKTNARTIAGLYGPETDDWRGKQITIYSERGNFFGEERYAVRIRKNAPGDGHMIPLIEEPWTEEMIEWEDAEPTYKNGTKVEMSNAGEVQAFETYIELEGHRPPSRAALRRWTGPARNEHDEEE